MSWSERFKNLTDPHHRLKRQKEVSDAYRAETKRLFSMNLEKITPESYGEKLAALGVAYEEMMQHELCEKFRRNNVSLYLNTVLDINFKKPRLKTPQAVGIKLIEIPREIEEILDAKELKAVTAHEMGHHLRLDLHPKRGALSKFTRGKSFEDSADKIAVVLSGEPEALISALDKIQDYQTVQMENARQYRHLGSPEGAKVEKWLLDRLKWVSEIFSPYTNLEDRKALIRETAERMKNPAEKAKLIEEISDELSKEHKKLFPKQFGRASGNMRA